jgi:hypothetical protein
MRPREGMCLWYVQQRRSYSDEDKGSGGKKKGEKGTRDIDK